MSFSAIKGILQRTNTQNGNQWAGAKASTHWPQLNITFTSAGSFLSTRKLIILIICGNQPCTTNATEIRLKTLEYPFNECYKFFYRTILRKAQNLDPWKSSNIIYAKLKPKLHIRLSKHTVIAVWPAWVTWRPLYGHNQHGKAQK